MFAQISKKSRNCRKVPKPRKLACSECPREICVSALLRWIGVTKENVHVRGMILRSFEVVAPPPPPPLPRKRHIPPHSAQSQHTNRWAPRTRKRHQQEHRPQRPTERSDPTQHAKGRTGDRPGPRKGATTRRNVTQGGGAGTLLPLRGWLEVPGILCWRVPVSLRFRVASEVRRPEHSSKPCGMPLRRQCAKCGFGAVDVQRTSFHRRGSPPGPPPLATASPRIPCLPPGIPLFPLPPPLVHRQRRSAWAVRLICFFGARRKRKRRPTYSTRWASGVVWVPRGGGGGDGGVAVP